LLEILHSFLGGLRDFRIVSLCSGCWGKMSCANGVKSCLHSEVDRS